MPENWKDSRAEAAMREEGRKIMKAAAEKKVQKELIAGKKVYQYGVAIVSHGDYDESDLMVLIAMINELKEKSEGFNNLEIKIKHLR